MTDWAIGIDFGSARSAAAAADRSGSQISTSGGPGRRVVPLEVAGRRAVSSTVALTAGGELVTGDPADELALVSPERAERSVKDVVGQAAPLLLGGHPVDVRDAVAPVLRPLIDDWADVTVRLREQLTTTAELTDMLRRAGAPSHVLPTVMCCHAPTASSSPAVATRHIVPASGP